MENDLFAILMTAAEQSAVPITCTEGATAVPMRQTCRKCERSLTLEEQHYYDAGDGSASCEVCESEWMVAMQEWKATGVGKMPDRP